MFEGIQRSLLEILQLQELAWRTTAPTKEFLSLLPIIQKKIHETISQTRLLCDTNIHCLAKISSLQQEKNDLIRVYEERIQKLETQLSSTMHTLDHQKVLQSNYSNFTSLQGYWKEILHGSQQIQLEEEDNLQQFFSSSNQPQGNNSSLNRLKGPQNSSNWNSLGNISLVNRSFEDCQQEIAELEDSCGKMLTWLSIQSYRELFLSSPMNNTATRLNQSQQHLNQSFLNQSMNSNPNNNSLLSALGLGGGGTNEQQQQQQQDSSYLWTQKMIGQAKKIREYCRQTIATLQQEDEEKKRFLMTIKELKKQKIRLTEKIIDSERIQETLRMANEEIRTIANGHLQKISSNENQLIKLYELLVNQKDVLQKYQQHSLNVPLPSSDRSVSTVTWDQSRHHQPLHQQQHQHQLPPQHHHHQASPNHGYHHTPQPNGNISRSQQQQQFNPNPPSQNTLAAHHPHPPPLHNQSNSHRLPPSSTSSLSSHGKSQNTQTLMNNKPFPENSSSPPPFPLISTSRIASNSSSGDDYGNNTWNSLQLAPLKNSFTQRRNANNSIDSHERSRESSRERNNQPLMSSSPISLSSQSMRQREVPMKRDPSLEYSHSSEELNRSSSLQNSSIDDSQNNNLYLQDVSFNSASELERHYELTLEKLANYDIH